MTSAGMTLGDLLGEQMKELYHVKKKGCRNIGQQTNEVKRRTLENSQARWEEDTGKAAWTKRLLPNIKLWVERPTKVEVTYYLAQALFDH